EIRRRPPDVARHAVGVPGDVGGGPQGRGGDQGGGVPRAAPRAPVGEAGGSLCPVGAAARRAPRLHAGGRRFRGALPRGFGMSERADRIAALLRRGESEREDPPMAGSPRREEIERRRAQWKAASMIATSIAIASTVAYRRFGKASLRASPSPTPPPASLPLLL